MLGPWVRSDWLVVVARAWSEGDRQLVRLVARDGEDAVVRAAVVSSNRAAADRLLAWLDEFAAPSPSPPGTAGPGDGAGDARMTPPDTQHP